MIVHLKTERIENEARDLIPSPSFSHNLLFDNEFSHDLSISTFSHAKLRENNIIKLAINVIIGVALLFLFNAFGAAWLGIVLPINWITALIVGILGIPGFIGVLIFFLIF